jgi:outer membrane protein assembly factor BamB
MNTAYELDTPQIIHLPGKSPLMKIKTLLLFILISILGAILSACTGAGVAVTSWPGLTVDGDTGYLAHAQHIYAINLTNGSEKWRFPAEPGRNQAFYAAPILTPDGQLIAGGYDFKLYSIDSTTGQLKWTFEGATDKYIAGPLVTEGAIFAPSADGVLYSLDFNGNLLWSFETGGPLWAQPTSDEACECIYLASMDHSVYAIEAATGVLKWKSAELGGAFVGTPAYGEQDSLYVGNFSNQMFGLNAENGKTRWQIPTQNWVWSGPAMQDNTLYFGDLNGDFYAVDATNGQQLWKLSPGSPILSTPLVAGDQIYYTVEAGTIYAVDTSGAPLWNNTIGGKLYAPPVANGDVILVTPLEGTAMLIALNQQGAQQWSFTPEVKK